MKSISMICFWSGPFPWYFPYFVDSCRYNESIDFFILYDNAISDFSNFPGNLNVIPFSIKELSNRCEAKLGIQINVQNAYKLNDFKPAFGYLFSEIVDGYDFWGFCDLDIILGRLRFFLDDDLLNQNDFISLRHDYTTGCFSLFRNNAFMNSLFMNSKDFRLVFSSPKHYCFDECNFKWDELNGGKSIFEINCEVQSLTFLVKDAERKGQIRTHFDFILMEGQTGKIVFDNGIVAYKQEFEAILYHLFWLKKVYAPVKLSGKIPNKYYISPTRIYHYRSVKKKK